MKSSILAVVVTVLLFSGCSVLGIGDVAESPCDGECDFKEAGVCADAISIYTHRGKLENRKVKEHWFSEDEDPYVESSSNGSSFIRINEEVLGE
jgi:hypothetical protein